MLSAPVTKDQKMQENEERKKKPFLSNQTKYKPHPSNLPTEKRKNLCSSLASIDMGNTRSFNFQCMDHLTNFPKIFFAIYYISISHL